MENNEVFTNPDFARDVVDHLDVDALKALLDHASSRYTRLVAETERRERDELVRLAAKYNVLLQKRRVVRPRTEKKRKPPTVKYADPTNPANTWTGRGRQPLWLRDKVAAGQDVRDFELQAA